MHPSAIQQLLNETTNRGARMPENAVHDLHQLLAESFDRLKLGKVDENSPAGACLHPLLMALGWSGEERHLVEALPHFDDVHNIDGLRAVLAALNFESINLTGTGTKLSAAKLPCLLVSADDNVRVVLRHNGGDRWMVYDGKSQQLAEINKINPSDTLYLVQPFDVASQQTEISKAGWVTMVISKFKRTISTVLLLSLAINLMAILVPLYIIGVYQLAIGAKSVATLLSLLAGVVLILMSEAILRVIRARALSYLGSRIESLVLMQAFQQLLYLPVEMTETSSVATQVTRLKQYQNVRSLFNGSLATSILDIPFITIFIVATFAVGGVLGFIPFALVFVYAAMAAITVPLARRHLRHAGTSKTRMRNFLMETTTKHKSIRDTGAQETWIKRYEQIAGDHLANQFKAQQFNFTVQSVAQLLMVLAGASTVYVGTLLAMEGSVTMGALIGATTLVWRGLSPIQSAFLGLSRMGQSIDSLKQVNHLMRLPVERQPGMQASVYRKFRGQIALKGVTLRYANQADPSLAGVNLDINRGELVAITGDSGAGKSTILKVIANLYKPQVGAVLIDDLHTRQLNLGELRHAIGYVPQKPSFFYGTISQNLRLAHPAATDADLIRGLKMAGILEAVNDLEGGLEFRLQGRRENRFADGFLRQLMLARAFVKDAPIYLLDEPGAQLDNAGDEILVQTLKALKGRATVVMVTHRPSHMHLADRVVVMHRGAVAMVGPPEQIVPMILNPKKAANTAA